MNLGPWRSRPDRPEMTDSELPALNPALELMPLPLLSFRRNKGAVQQLSLVPIFPHNALTAFPACTLDHSGRAEVQVETSLQMLVHADLVNHLSIISQTKCCCCRAYCSRQLLNESVVLEVY